MSDQTGGKFSRTYQGERTSGSRKTPLPAWSIITSPVQALPRALSEDFTLGACNMLLQQQQIVIINVLVLFMCHLLPHCHWWQPLQWGGLSAQWAIFPNIPRRKKGWWAEKSMGSFTASLPFCWRLASVQTVVKRKVKEVILINI